MYITSSSNISSYNTVNPFGQQHILLNHHHRFNQHVGPNSSSTTTTTTTSSTSSYKLKRIDEPEGNNNCASETLNNFELDDINTFEIKTTNIRDHINKFVYNHGVEKEFYFLEKRTEKDLLHGDFRTALKEENKMKNRYINVLPVEPHRVRLSVDSDDESEGSDYINASYINDPLSKNKEKKYICTQGPLENTFNDFWKMVWEVKSNIIVMLTKEEESNIKKCDRYWIDAGSKDYGNIRVQFDTSIVLHEFIQRYFTLENLKTKEKRRIIHYQYIAWPDHGTPVSIKEFLNLIAAVEKEPKTGPIIVHCSAGIGRSGTFCVIHSVVTNSISGGGADSNVVTLNIPKIIANFRSQRPGMVQNKEQYRFCYLAIAEGTTSLEQLRKGRRSLSYSIN
ncbi:hypothetical protein SAMD00019534_038640, partial [Acytostelium subglobosum LB1]|uniref:hypothetical protein n=1 Tax=Acytostelium subglobosum LB1 TaxID=1410327 RepID=UPI000644E0B4